MLSPSLALPRMTGAGTKDRRYTGDLIMIGTTMLMATHDLRLAATIASNVVYLDGGRVVEAGPARQVFGAPSDPRTRTFISTLTAQTGEIAG